MHIQLLLSCLIRSFISVARSVARARLLFSIYTYNIIQPCCLQLADVILLLNRRCGPHKWFKPPKSVSKNELSSDSLDTLACFSNLLFSSSLGLCDLKKNHFESFWATYTGITDINIRTLPHPIKCFLFLFSNIWNLHYQIVWVNDIIPYRKNKQNTNIYALMQLIYLCNQHERWTEAAV